MLNKIWNPEKKIFHFPETENFFSNFLEFSIFLKNSSKKISLEKDEKSFLSEKIKNTFLLSDLKIINDFESQVSSENIFLVRFIF